MCTSVLITGGAGFIGSHLADELLAQGYRVRALDCLAEQVHGPGQRRPEYLDGRVELVVGEIGDRTLLRSALEGVDCVVHLAAAVGVGQSMYRIEDYTRVNNIGTAILLEELIRRPVRRLLVASSMSIYGEGAYRNSDGALEVGCQRTPGQLQAGRWELEDPRGAALAPIATGETKPPLPASVYALSKYDQERMCLMIGETYGIATVALRFFNVYGPRQALSNPYTGVLAIFAARILNNRPPLIFEDGLQQRDFVSVHDVARACRLALESPHAPGEVFNVGSGQAVTIREVARQLGEVLERPELRAQISGKYRAGDVRHCFADVEKARGALHYEPRVSFRSGLLELATWLEEQAAADCSGAAGDELVARGLVV